jgi:hypothetical protein
VVPNPNQQDHAYLTKNWDVLAAVAWHEYTVHGRGALLVQNVGQRDEHCVYLPVKMLDGPLAKDFARMATEYMPRQEIVIVLMHPCSVSAYRGSISGRETPIEAHGRLARVLFG